MKIQIGEVSIIYAHCNSLYVKQGDKVTQGQEIAEVGSTGNSTGPHLHYEFQVNGVHVDPLSQKWPTAEPIHASEKKRFMEFSKPLLAKLDTNKDTQLALNEQQ